MYDDSLTFAMNSYEIRKKFYPTKHIYTADCIRQVAIILDNMEDDSAIHFY